MKEAFDKMLSEEKDQAPAGGEVDLSAFDEGAEEADEDTKLSESLASLGYNASPDQIVQIKEILKGEAASGGEAGAPPPDNSPAKPKSKMDVLFGGK